MTKWNRIYMYLWKLTSSVGFLWWGAGWWWRWWGAGGGGWWWRWGGGAGARWGWRGGGWWGWAAATAVIFDLGSLEGPQLSLGLLVGLLEFHIKNFASVWSAEHGKSLASLHADDLIFLVLAGGNDSPLLRLALWVVHLGDGSLLLVSGEYFHLSIFETVESKTVVVGVVTLLGDENLVPWAITLLVVSNDGWGPHPVVVVGAPTAVINDLVVLLVDGDDLGLATENSGGAVSLLTLDTLLLFLMPVLSLWALVFGPAALVRVALEVAAAVVGVGALLVFVLSVALLVLGGVLLAWARSALVASSGTELAGALLRRGGGWAGGGGRRGWWRAGAAAGARAGGGGGGAGAAAGVIVVTLVLFLHPGEGPLAVGGLSLNFPLVLSGLGALSAGLEGVLGVEVLRVNLIPAQLLLDGLDHLAHSGALVLDAWLWTKNQTNHYCILFAQNSRIEQ